MTHPGRLIVSISGASGIVYGVRLLETLRDAEIETHLVMTKAAQMTLAHEMAMKVADAHRLAGVVAPHRGYRRIHFQRIVPNHGHDRGGSLSEIASGVTSNLLKRAADAILKERRPLVLMVRGETPLHLAHLHSMAQATEIAAILMPPVPAFYARPKTIDNLVAHSVGRAMDLCGTKMRSLAAADEPAHVH